MNSSQVYGAILDIAGVSSTLAKSKTISEVIDDETFQRVCKLVYDPNSNFGVFKIRDDASDGSGSADFDDTTWKLFSDLQTRTLTGNQARDSIVAEINRMNKPSCELFKRILRKNLQAGFSVKLLNKAKKGLIPTTPYMRCSLPKQKDLDALDWEEGVVSQEKADGMFGNISVYGNDDVEIKSRDGKRFPNESFEQFVSEVCRQFEAGYQYHGEFLVLDDGMVLPREQGNGIMNSLNNGLGRILPSQKVIYNVWDKVKLCDVADGKSDVPYAERLESLKSDLERYESDSIRLIDTRICHSLSEAKAHYAEMVSSGKEGTILKKLGLKWKNGTSKDVYKLKIEFEADFKIVNILMGKDGTRVANRPASITVQSSDGQVISNVTIKDEQMRDDIEASPSEWIGRIVAVKANNILEKNGKYSLFLPRLAENSYRTDKDEADDTNRVIEQYHNTLLG